MIDLNTSRGLLILPLDFNSYWVDLASAIGLTTLGLHPIPDLTPEDPRSLESFLTQIRSNAFRNTFQKLSECGIHLEIEIHAMHLLIPRKMFDARPEWFRMNEAGIRCRDKNFCPSNEDALQYVEAQAERLAHELAPYTTSHRYFIWIDDNSQSCLCSECRWLSPSDLALLIYNHILKGVRRADPFGTQSYLAYNESITAPSKVSPESGIFLEYAPIRRDSRYSMDDSRCVKNMNEGVNIQPLLDYFGKEGSQVLEYWMDNSRFYEWKWNEPFGEMPFYSGVLRRDVQFYRSFGFENIRSFACGLNEEYSIQYGELPVVEYGNALCGQSLVT